MSYRNLLVCLDDSARSAQRMDMALRFAALHDARLTALMLNEIPAEARAAIAAGLVAGLDAERSLERRRHAVQQDFELKARNLGVTCAWVCAGQHETQDVVAFGRSFDLVLAGQHDPDEEKVRGLESFPDYLLLGVGRPVLLLPARGALPERYEHIAVAWNGSREAARALADAMPLLLQAERVTVLTVTPPPARHERSGQLRPPEIAEVLQHHGIRASHITNPCAPNEASWLLARTQELHGHADLLVAGAYGHSRVSELLMGGVTRTLLRELTVPALLSH